jgi:TonB-linked SusC/RagA family outer membrane protein
MIFASHLYAQTASLSIDMSAKPIAQVLEKIEEQTDFHFFYNSKLLDMERKVSVKVKDKDIFSVLNQLFAGTNVRYRVIDKDIILTVNEIAGTAQNSRRITGTVTDSNGEPIIGANIVEKGTTNGTITDFQGQYSLEVSNNATLTISYIGFISKEIAVGNQTTINTSLDEDMQALDEVIVIGYGTMKKSDLTGAVSNVKAEKLLDRPAINVGQALSGKAAGVEIFENGGDPDGKIRIRIRGDNSINSSNDPLYVVDGIIGVNNVNLLNPSDIESLEVLKDASATAIYGARGANGVIMITTKRGIKLDKPVISYDGYLSVGSMAKKMELMNAAEWWQTYNATFDNAAKYDPEGFASGKYTRASTASMPNLFDASGNPIYDTDWQDVAYRTAVSHNHQLSIRGGSDKTQYSAHLGYTRREALLKNNYLNRYSGRLNIDSELRSWLKMGLNMSYNYSKGNNLYSSYSIKRLVQEAIPIIPVKYPDGTWGSNRDFPGAVQDTPARYLEEMARETTNSQVLSDIYFDFIINKDLSFKSTFAVDVSNRKVNYYSGKELTQYSKTQGGIATINTQNQVYWQNENYLNWNKQFNAHNRFNLMVGLSWQQRYTENLGTEARNFSDDFYQWHNLAAGSVSMPATSSDNRWSINSYFARINYNLYERYLFTATGRYDGSSKFGKNNRYAFFPSFAFAWRVSEESFLKDNSSISNLKLRTSIGATGNQEIGNYEFLQNLASTNTIFASSYYTSLYRSTFGNPDLKWEKTVQWDIGSDISLFDQRIDFSADLFYKETSDLLLRAPVPNTSGLDNIMRNIGSVRNQGIELTLTTHNIKSKDFNWSSTFMFNTNKNKVLSLGENDEDIFPDPVHAQGNLVILRVGEPVGSLWGLTRLGTWGENEAEEAAKYSRLPGDLKYADLNNDGRINSDDNSIIGCTSPDWTLTFSNMLQWKNFDFSFDLRVVYGHNVVNASTHNAEDRSGVANGFKNNLNAWTPTNQNTMVAQRRPMSTYYDSYPDTHWMRDGSFLRGQNFALGYNFEKSMLKRIKIDHLRVYISAQNLFCITDYNGYDPEVTTREGAAFGQGIDDFSEPKARTFTFGLNIKF